MDMIRDLELFSWKIPLTWLRVALVVFKIILKGFYCTSIRLVILFQVPIMADPNRILLSEYSTNQALDFFLPEPPILLGMDLLMLY